MPTVDKNLDAKPDYQAFLASLDVYMIALTHSAFRIQRDEYFEGSEDNKISFKLSSKSNSVGEKHFDVRSTLNLTASNEKSKKILVRFTATFELHLHASPVNEEFVKRFCESEIRLIVWPYFREYVSDVTARMYIPPLILPLSEHTQKSKM
jgi:preprotein translocase subunit SecB